MAERFAFYGLASNLITYFTKELGQSTAIAAQNVNMWMGVSSVLPVVGAFVADSFLRRFKTLLLSSFVYLLGIVMLPLTVSLVPLLYRRVAFFTGLYVTAVGEGGFKPCIQTFAADQFDEDKPEERAAKSSFFNWWYVGIVAGGSISMFVVVYIMDQVSLAVGFSIIAGGIAAAVIFLMIGIKRYRKQITVGSPFTTMAQVCVAAMRKRRVSQTCVMYEIYDQDDQKDEIDPKHQAKEKYNSLDRTNQFRYVSEKNLDTPVILFLDKATIIDEIDASNKTRNPWRLSSVNQVEETKLVLRLIPIWLSLLMYSSTNAQLNTFFTKQGSTMKRNIGNHFTIPPASLQSIAGLTILVCVPLYERVFVPTARNITKHPSGITMLQRIGIGLFLATLNMAICGLVEAKRIGVAEEQGHIGWPKVTVEMGIWWLLPQYMLTGMGDTFAMIGMQELFYDQMPKTMRSVGAAAYLSAAGIGSFICNGIISITQVVSEKFGEKWLGDDLNHAHLDKFYYAIALLNLLSLLAYMWITKYFVYKKVRDGASDTPEEEQSSDGRV